MKNRYDFNEDENDELYYGRQPEYLMKGLSRNAQNRLIHDAANKIAFQREMALSGGKDTPRTIHNIDRYATDLESRVRSMPEPLQDAFLRTIGGKDNVQFRTYGDVGHFDPHDKRVELKYDLAPNGYIHEVGGHKTMDALKDRKDRIKPAGLYTEAMVMPTPDAAVENNLGKSFHQDYGYKFHNTFDDIGAINKTDELIESYPEYHSLLMNDKARLKYIMLDNVGMDPNNMLLNNFAHDERYRRNIKNEVTPFFHDWERISYAPLSIEGAAHAAEIMSMPRGGAQLLQNHLPNYSHDFLNILEGDTRPTPQWYIDRYGSMSDRELENRDNVYGYRYYAIDNDGVPQFFKSRKKMNEFNDLESGRHADSFMRDTRKDYVGPKPLKFYQARNNIKYGNMVSRKMFYKDKNGNLIEIKDKDKVK